MSSIFMNTLNTRPILENSLKYIRSDVPTQISEDESFMYYCMPVTGGSAIPKSVNEVSKSYIKMVDEQLCEIVDFMMNVNSNVLYFCNVGKDRTGVISAILLMKAGMDIEYIIDDYMKSESNLKVMLEDYTKQNQEVDIHVITPHERYIRDFIEWYIANSGKKKN